ncbi:MAG TPA: ribosomal RNA small subunit methyltransferase A [Phycisphaerae bacterium]|nr:ribosomal RNA small subunit methyltransferase A [Phycisphaerae bacterium]
MQTLKEIQALLDQAGARPQKRLAQSFLIDLNLMGKLLEIAELRGNETILEVGAGTGSLTEELLRATPAGRVIAVEIDRGLAGLLRNRFAEQLSIRSNLTLIEGDVLGGKNRISPVVLTAAGPRANLVANLPYSIATPMVAECMLESWRSLRGEGVRFDRLTFTVQHEVAERFAAAPGRRAGRAYGQVSVILGLLGRVKLGPVIPPTAFWPQPKVSSRIVRVDFDAHTAGQLHDAVILRAVLNMVFTQRRKHISSTARARGAVFGPRVFSEALEKAGVNPTARAGELPPEAYRDLANVLCDLK